ncbi:cyclic nucleotide-binding domain-containing protein [Sphingomonas sp. BN140010]|uniref:Cyclic nucleotide-binding domain-containing protein n=1 Tax=Sphingomonas arvum TaxID=2992113 RepID=A0ABT3JBX5_9SPHN|nr:cyclic nucleotide-binding domain-containing protein [Sphingomonas sp. BN140010]MCW3796575.1 cyclic nucleotide-binding domain-containing protein [Sphingomonas sp. BN140010]
MASAAPRTLADLPTGHPCGGCDARRVALCGVLDCTDLTTLRCLGGTQALTGGHALFHEGDRASQVYNITNGAIRLTKLLPDGRRQVMGFMFPGDFLGITLGDEHAFTAEALGDTLLCRFPRARFDEFVEEHPELERELYRKAAHELAAAQAQMLLLGRKSAAERLASFFLDLAARQQRLTAATSRFVDLPMCRADVADYLGLTKETVSRLLAQLKQQRLLRLETLNQVELLDLPGLTTLAEGGADMLAA